MEARCLLCNHDLAPVGQDQVGPLWQRLDHYLQLPFALPLLPLLAIWAVLAALVAAMATASASSKEAMATSAEEEEAAFLIVLRRA